MSKKNIIVIGLGYVGCSMSVLLSQKHNVAAVDIDKSKVDLINNGEAPIEDKEISQFLSSKDLHLTAFIKISEAVKTLKKVDYFIIATPTNFIEYKNKFDTSSIETVLKQINLNYKNANVVIKSTIPIGFTDEINKEFEDLKIIFSPEFLREGKALFDNLYPDRIIAGGHYETAKGFIELLKSCAKKNNIDHLIVENSDAEAIKLFSNTYLAMRVAFFNELDTFAMENSLSSKSIIDGMGMDNRIGNYYNNPSFGYGGYCLPKDTKQLLSNYRNVPQSLISSIVESNEVRKSYLANSIISKKPNVVGIFRLVMKSDSDNFRESAISDLIIKLKNSNIEIIIYEPMIADLIFNGIDIENNLANFKMKSDIIISNRNNQDLNDVSHKLFTRDVYGNN